MTKTCMPIEGVPFINEIGDLSTAACHTWNSNQGCLAKDLVPGSIRYRAAIRGMWGLRKVGRCKNLALNCDPSAWVGYTNFRWKSGKPQPSALKEKGPIFALLGFSRTEMV